MIAAAGGTPLNVDDFIRRSREPREIPYLTTVLSGMPKTSRILDVGCGSGSVARFYYDLGYTDMHGVELDAALVEYAHRELGFLDIRKRSGEDLRCFADDAFDVVYSIHALEHMLHPEAAVREMRRVLKPGGRALLSVPNGRHLDDVLTQLAQKAYYGKSDHVQSFSVGSFHALLERCGLVVLDTKANRGSLTLLLDERLPLAPVCSKVLFPIARLLYNGVRSFDVLATKERSG